MSEELSPRLRMRPGETKRIQRVFRVRLARSPAQSGRRARTGCQYAQRPARRQKGLP